MGMPLGSERLMDLSVELDDWSRMQCLFLCRPQQFRGPTGPGTVAGCCFATSCRRQFYCEVASLVQTLSEFSDMAQVSGCAYQRGSHLKRWQVDP